MKKILLILIGSCLLGSALAQPELGFGQVWHKSPDNPIFLNEGAAGTWNEGENVGTNMGACVIWDSLAAEYKLYQTGRKDDVRSIGLFTSDSLSGPWAEYEHNPIFTADTSFWATYEILAPHVLYDNGTYKMWFSGSDSTDIAKIGYAESADGISWTPLDTAIFGPGGATDWDSEGIEQLFVIKKGENDYIGWYVGEGISNFQIGCATSEDGINWSRASDDPVLRNESPTSAWMNTIYVLMKNDKYLMWYSGANSGYILMDPGKVCFALSENGIDWRQDKLYNPVFRNGSSNQWDERFVGVSGIFERADHFEMFYLGADDDWDHISYGKAIYKPTDIAAGNVSGTWTKDGSPYLVKGEITVPNGQTLTIEPGSTVEFCGYYPLNVQGRLLAEGTASNKIRFWRDDTLGLNNMNDNNGVWSGIRFLLTPISNDSSIISHCDIAFGKAQEYTQGNYGGGLIVVNFDRIRIEDCRIHHNYAIGSTLNKNAAGGGLYIQRSNIKVNRNIIEYNLTRHLNESLVASGGGLIALFPSTPEITNNTIRYNRSTRDGGGVTIWSNSSAYLANNLIVNNTALSFYEQKGGGGGVGVGLHSSPVLINNTIADNTANRGGGVFIDSSMVTVINTIIANNDGLTDYDQFHYNDMSEGYVRFYFSCLEGEAGNEWEYNSEIVDTFGVIMKDPELISNYKLLYTSPCICAARKCLISGQYTFRAPIIDYENDPRPQPEGTFPDIGAIESSIGTIIDTLGCIVHIVDIPEYFELNQNYPNPFNPRTTINYQLSTDSDVNLTIYDITGRKVQTLVNEYQSSGYHTLIWNASGFSSGIYLYQLKAGDFVETKKMLLMK